MLRVGATVTVGLLLLTLFPAVCVAKTYTNPVITPNSPDPGVLKWGERYFVVTTSNADAPAFNGDYIFPIHESTDLVEWKLVGYVFNGTEEKPSWAATDFWAPELHAVNGTIVVYFSARDSTSNLLCLGAAVSASGPTGPFRGLSRPLAQDPGLKMGYIDVTYHQGVLIWKHDGNAIGAPTPIVAQEVAADGLSFVPGTQPRELLRESLPWEGTLTEAPWVYVRNHTHYLFYSANGYDRVDADGQCPYSVGVARSASGVFGPYEKHPLPVLSAAAASTLTGPGHCSVVDFGEQVYMVYHAWSRGAVGAGHARHMLVDRVSWGEDGWPVVHGDDHPSDDPEPVPVAIASA